MRFRGTLTSTLMISVLAASAAPALAADGRADGTAVVTRAMERDLGLSPDQAKAQNELQEQALKLDDELESSLGDAYAGSQYDFKSGKLIVMVSDKEALEKASAAGADARFAAHSLRELTTIQPNLDAQTGGAPNPAERAQTKPQGSPFTSWYIDPVSNSVHIPATKRQAAAARDLIAKYGDAVSVEI